MGHAKRCSRCGKSKSSACFRRDRKAKDGLSCYCNECVREYQAERRRKLSSGVTKACSKCGVRKSAKEFGVSRKMADGLQYYCKPCAREDRRIRRGMSAARRSELELESAVFAERKAALIAEHGVDLVSDSRGWAQRTAASHRRRGVCVDLLPIDSLQEMFIRATQCPLCGCALRRDRPYPLVPETATLDNRDNSGGLNPGNSWIVCHSCNSTKRDRSLSEFVAYCRSVVTRLGD